MAIKNNFLDMHFRITRQQKDKLERISAMTGLKTSEVLREVIDNVDETTLKNSIEYTQEKENREIEILARQKYLINLFKNVTSNINQIAKYVNYGTDVTDENLSNVFKAMTRQVDELRREVYERCKGSFDKKR